MKCETCRYRDTETELTSYCHWCDGYKNYEPENAEQERLDYIEAVANDFWKEQRYNEDEHDR